MVLKDMIWTGIETAVGEHPCPDVALANWGKGRKGVPVGKYGTQHERWAGGHVGTGVREPVGDGVVEIGGRTSCRREETGEGGPCAGAEENGGESKDVL